MSRPQLLNKNIIKALKEQEDIQQSFSDTSASTLSLVFKDSSKFTAAFGIKAHAAPEISHCDGRRRNLFLNNSNIP